MNRDPINWEDHVVEHPNRYKMIDNRDGSVDLVREPGQVWKEGTPVNAVNLNIMDQDILKKADKPAEYIEGNLASLDEGGNLRDSGRKAEEVLLKSDVIHDADTADEGRIPGADVTAGLQEQINDVNGYITRLNPSSTLKNHFAEGETLLEFVDSCKVNTTKMYTHDSFCPEDSPYVIIDYESLKQFEYIAEVLVGDDFRKIIIIYPFNSGGSIYKRMFFSGDWISDWQSVDQINPIGRNENYLPSSYINRSVSHEVKLGSVIGLPGSYYIVKTLKSWGDLTISVLQSAENVSNDQPYEKYTRKSNIDNTWTPWRNEIGDVRTFMENDDTMSWNYITPLSVSEACTMHLYRCGNICQIHGQITFEKDLEGLQDYNIGQLPDNLRPFSDTYGLSVNGHKLLIIMVSQTGLISMSPLFNGDAINEGDSITFSVLYGIK